MASSSSSPTPTILYSCIANRTTILSEHTATSSSEVSNLASQVLLKINPSSPEKQTYVQGSYNIHYLSPSPFNINVSSSSSKNAKKDTQLIYLAITPLSSPRSLAFSFLSTVQTAFISSFPPSSTAFSNLRTYGCAAFNPTLAHLMSISTPENKDAIKNAQKEIDEARGIMNENIERVLERGERMDTLIDKTGRLQGSARDFRMKGTNLQRRMWWKDVKLRIMLGGVGIVGGYLVVGAGCGLPAWGRCIR